MNTVELLEYSLGTALGILDQVTTDLTQEQADWMPPGIANPIGAMYWHTISGVDDPGASQSKITQTIPCHLTGAGTYQVSLIVHEGDSTEAAIHFGGVNAAGEAELLRNRRLGLSEEEAKAAVRVGRFQSGFATSSVMSTSEEILAMFGAHAAMVRASHSISSGSLVVTSTLKGRGSISSAILL